MIRLVLLVLMLVVQAEVRAESADNSKDADSASATEDTNDKVTTGAEDKDAEETRETADTDSNGRVGIYDDKIVIGQSASLSGVAKGLGINMRLGLHAAVAEINAKGGVHKRKLELVTLDDGYEPELTINNVHKLIDKHKVFTLVGG